MLNSALFSGLAVGQRAVHLRVIETTDLHQHLLPYDYYADRPLDGIGLAHAAHLIDAARAEAGERHGLRDAVGREHDVTARTREMHEKCAPRPVVGVGERPDSVGGTGRLSGGQHTGHARQAAACKKAPHPSCRHHFVRSLTTRPAAQIVPEHYRRSRIHLSPR